MTLLRVPPPLPKAVDLKRTYDAIVVGSGAAGGMAAHVLTSHGLDVLLLEAGRQLDTTAELKSLEWPYDHPRRGDMPYTSHALRGAEYALRKPPYAPKDSPWKTVQSYVQGWNGSDYSKNILVNEKEHPYTGTNYAWVRARVLGGKTNIWGRLALRLSDYDFKGKSHDGWGEDWPISYADIEPYYDKVDLYLGISGHPEGLAHLPDSKFQRATRLNAAEVMLRQSMAKSGKVLTPYRAGVTTDGLKHNKFRSRCFGRGACNRRAGGCDIHAAFDSPTGLIYPALETGHLIVRTGSVAREVTVDPATGKARGVSFVDAATGEALEARAKVVVVGASTLESARLLLNSKSAQHPSGIANSSGHVGHNFCEHVMGPGVDGFVKDLVGKPRTLDDGRPGGFYVPRFRNLKDKQKDFVRGYGFEGSAGTGMFPGASQAPGFGASYKKMVREYAGATVGMGGFGEVLSRYENAVSIDPEVKDKWGVPVLRFDFKFGDNEKKMAADMANTAKEIFEEAGIEVVDHDRHILTEGWSIHELGTARMGNDPKTSVLTQHQQSHDVKNLFVVDGSSHVSASCQNPTWTIMALAWRSCDYLADELRKGNL
ncbi:MAG: GMC family oxidoreductase [Acidobacteria bacterium]|nr:MAG: GMC family oxidoreductase [Acidobacteriota bacterium]